MPRPRTFRCWSLGRAACAALIGLSFGQNEETTSQESYQRLAGIQTESGVRLPEADVYIRGIGSREMIAPGQFGIDGLNPGEYSASVSFLSHRAGWKRSEYVSFEISDATEQPLTLVVSGDKVVTFRARAPRDESLSQVSFHVRTPESPKDKDHWRRLRKFRPSETDKESVTVADFPQKGPLEVRAWGRWFSRGLQGTRDPAAATRGYCR